MLEKSYEVYEGGTIGLMMICLLSLSTRKVDSCV